MLKTILFDLDGTLLPVDTDNFIRHYMKALATHAGHLVPPARLVEQVLASTVAMVKNTDPAVTNEQVFADDFFPKVGRPYAELMPVFDQFYRDRFPLLREACPVLPGPAREVVKTALDQGYEVVLATNPVFPRVAIEERMRWIGVADLPWQLVTTYEEMHACKPQPAYYSEVAAKIGRRPEDCLMVGNDVEEDGAAAAVGMQTYFVTDRVINRNNKELTPDGSGSMTDFLQRLQAGKL